MLPDTFQQYSVTEQRAMETSQNTESDIRTEKKVFYCESYITLEQAAQRGYGISLSGETKKPHGCFFILSTALSYIDLGTGSSPQNAALTHKHE